MLSIFVVMMQLAFNSKIWSKTLQLKFNHTKLKIKYRSIPSVSRNQSELPHPGNGNSAVLKSNFLVCRKSTVYEKSIVYFLPKTTDNVVLTSGRCDSCHAEASVQCNVHDADNTGRHTSHTCQDLGCHPRRHLLQYRLPHPTDPAG